MRGLDQKQLSAIDRWVEFFDRKKSYKHVGRLVLPDIDPNSEAPSMCKDPVFVFGP